MPEITEEQKHVQALQKQLLIRLKQLLNKAIERPGRLRPAEAFYESVIALIDGQDPLFPGLVLTTRNNPRFHDRREFKDGVVLNQNDKLQDLPY